MKSTMMAKQKIAEKKRLYRLKKNRLSPILARHKNDQVTLMQKALTASRRTGSPNVRHAPRDVSPHPTSTSRHTDLHQITDGFCPLCTRNDRKTGPLVPGIMERRVNLGYSMSSRGAVEEDVFGRDSVRKPQNDFLALWIAKDGGELKPHLPQEEQVIPEPRLPKSEQVCLMQRASRKTSFLSTHHLSIPQCRLVDP